VTIRTAGEAIVTRAVGWALLVLAGKHTHRAEHVGRAVDDTPDLEREREQHGAKQPREEGVRPARHPDANHAPISVRHRETLATRAGRRRRLHKGELDEARRRCYFDIRQNIKMLRTEEVFRAISDPTRRRVLKLLQRGSKTAGELSESFDITKGSLSHHFNVLKAADLVRSERRGQTIVYSLNTTVFEDVASLLMDLFRVEPRKEEQR
jgi:ArsR family transcriptional regulator, arsenate/arsenite/antimonite-responsive transcriptional repressor